MDVARQQESKTEREQDPIVPQIEYETHQKSEDDTENVDEMED